MADKWGGSGRSVSDHNSQLDDSATETTTPDVQLTVELGQRIPFATYEFVAHRLLTILEDVESRIAGQDHAAHWVIQDDATVRIAASPNGVSAATLRNVVDEVQRGFGSTDVPDGQQVTWPPGMGQAARRAIGDIVGRLKKDLDAITIIADDGPPLTIERAPAPGQMAKHLRGYVEYGQIDGFLDLISYRGGPHFGIEEHVTGRRIRCTFPGSLFDDVKAALRQRVVLEGMIHFRRDGTPVSVREIKHFFLRPRETRPISDLIGSLPNFTEGVPAGEYVRRLREADDRD